MTVDPPTSRSSTAHVTADPPTRRSSTAHVTVDPPTRRSSTAHVTVDPPTRQSSTAHVTVDPPTRRSSTAHVTVDPPTRRSSTAHMTVDPPTRRSAQLRSLTLALPQQQQIAGFPLVLKFRKFEACSSPEKKNYIEWKAGDWLVALVSCLTFVLVLLLASCVVIQCQQFSAVFMSVCLFVC